MKNTIDYFKEISKIPRESGNEEEISNYLVSFAKERKLKYIKDKYNNVIIIKKINSKEPIILQAHMDMVCESNCNYDFKNNGIKIIEDNGYLKSVNTTLGADNGIGISQILNILDNYNYNIEAIFTVSEETSMMGAEMIDISILKGKKLINLDGFNQNIIINECAAFNDIVIKTNYTKKIIGNKNIYKVSILDLPGGHSGADIDKNIKNSIKELGKIIKKIEDIQISTLNGGTKFNVIPSDSECIFQTNKNIEELEKIINIKKNEYKLNVEKINNYNDLFLDNKDSINLLNSINNLKNGVINKHNGKVTTSHNLGVINIDKNEIKIGMRSSRICEEKNNIIYLNNWSKKYGYKLTIQGRQPGFRTRKNKNLINTLSKYNKNAKVESIHVSLELGFFQEKIKDLEIAVISPQIDYAHTVNERVLIKSIYQCDEWLKKYLDSLH